MEAVEGDVGYGPMVRCSKRDILWAHAYGEGKGIDNAEGRCGVRYVGRMRVADC